MTLGARLQRAPLFGFFALTFAWSWACWALSPAIRPQLPDMQVPEMDREHMAGNHVLLRCPEADVLIGHLTSGSVQVRPGDAVVTGVWLGALGNSGNTGEPHLHVHAQRPGPSGAPIRGDPLPIVFDGHFPVRGDRIGSP